MAIIFFSVGVLLFVIVINSLIIIMFADTQKFSFRFTFFFSDDQLYVTATTFSHLCSNFLFNYYIPIYLYFNLICLLFSCMSIWIYYDISTSLITLFYSIILHYNVLYRIISYYDISYHIILYYIRLSRVRFSPKKEANCTLWEAAF